MKKFSVFLDVFLQLACYVLLIVAVWKKDTGYNRYCFGRNDFNKQ